MLTQQKALTMIELMVVVALFAILLLMGVPSYRHMIQEGRIRTTVDNLTTSLQYARSTAITRGQPVTICASSDGTRCDTDDWRRGWIVFVDQGTAGVLETGDTVLKVFRHDRDNGVNVNMNGLSYLQFLPTGATQSG